MYVNFKLFQIKCYQPNKYVGILRGIGGPDRHAEQNIRNGIASITWIQEFRIQKLDWNEL